MRRQDRQAVAEGLGQIDICIDGHAYVVTADHESRDLEDFGPLIARLQEMHFNVLQSYFDGAETLARGRTRGRAARRQKLVNGAALHDPGAVFELADLNARVSDDDPVNDSLAVEQKVTERHADADLVGRNDASHRLRRDQFGVIEFNFRATQSPTRVHAREFDRHPDRRTRPAFDVFLVFRQARQEQPKQPNCNCEQDYDAARQVGKKLDDAFQNTVHRLLCMHAVTSG